MSAEKPRIAIPMGYPAGIGPEVIVKTLSRPEAYSSCNPFVIGDSNVMKDALKITRISNRLNIFEDVKNAAFSFGKIDVLDVQNVDMDEFKYGVITESFGRASMEYVAKAFQLAFLNLLDGIVIAPVCKEAYHMANQNYNDDVDFLKEFSRSPKVLEVKLVSTNTHQVIMTKVTGHMRMRDVPDNIKMEKVVSSIRTADEACKQILGTKAPRIAVSSLNPHAGEGGLYGSEEIDEISPAVEKARRLGINASGPYPATTVYRNVFRGEFDAVVGMHHNEINLAKNLAGKASVHMYVGLFVPCVTVDHGTAFDIAGKGIADSKQCEFALQAVMKLAGTKWS